jgi:hypothetical protein
VQTRYKTLDELMSQEFETRVFLYIIEINLHPACKFREMVIN